MDKSVKRIRPADRELSMVQENLAQAIQQLLDYANQAAPGQSTLTPVLYQPNGAGTPMAVKTLALLVKGRQDGNYQVGQQTVQIGEFQTTLANSQIVPQRDATTFHIGQFVFWGSKGLPDGVVIFPQVAGLAFRVAALDQTTNTFSVASDVISATVPLTGKAFTGTAFTGTSFSGTSFTGSTFTSDAGFKNTISCGTMWNNNYTANTNAQLQVSCYNTSTALGAVTSGTAPRAVKMPFAGSVVGASLSQSGTVTGTNRLIIFKNGVSTATWIAGTGVGQFWTTFAKNTNGLTFVAGDTYTFFVQNTTAGNCQIQADITVEMVA